MKVWFKLLFGSLLGALLGFILPRDNELLMRALLWLEAFALRAGRYVTVPLLVCSLTVAVFELRQDGRFWRLFFTTALLILGSAVVVIAAGILATLLFPPARVPIQAEEQVEQILLGTVDNALALLPSNMLSPLAGDGVYLLPLGVFAFFMGIGLSYDRAYVKPVAAFFDSLSRVFYHLASLFLELLAIAMIALAAYWAVRLRGALEAGIFRDIIILLGALSALLGFGILPLFLYLLGNRPWRAVYGSLGQGIAAFFSGDINFTLPVMFQHLKESLGLRRRANAVTVTLCAAFGRAGSAMVAASAFIVIMNSYSSLGVSITGILDIGGRAALISLLLAARPADGAYAALATLCLGYGHGFEAGYLILKPLAFYLIAAGAFLDVMIASLVSFAAAKLNGFQEDKPVRRFI